MVKRLPTMQETRVQSLGWKDLLAKEMATHSSILAWKMLWMEEPSTLQSTGSQRVGHNWTTSFWLFTFKTLIFSTPFHLGVWLLAWLLSPLLTFPFLYQVTSISSLPLLFSTQCCESLDVLGCGEHLGNWLLARSLSLSFWLPLFSSWSPLSPSSLFSVKLCRPLWVFQDVGSTKGIDYWLECSLPFWFPHFSSWSPLSPSSLFSSSCNSVNLSGYPPLWRIFSPLT